MFNYKLQILIILQVLFIIPHTEHAFAVKRIILVGDSILDNAYWNGVGANTTGQFLVKMLNSNDNIQYENGRYVLVDDRSVEEATASAMVKALKRDGNINIPNRNSFFYEGYIERRKRNGVDYDSTSEYSARLYKYCNIKTTKNIAQVNILSDIKNSYVFISAGGNDLVLNFSFPFTIIDNIKKLATLYKKLGAKKVTYIIPYTATNDMGYFKSAAINACRSIFKFFYLDKLEAEYFDAIIDLSDFNDDYRKANYAIPEPTIKGAEEIAKRIAYILNLF